jgi:hypothetical protein
MRENSVKEEEKRKKVPFLWFIPWGALKEKPHIRRGEHTTDGYKNDLHVNDYVRKLSWFGFLHTRVLNIIANGIRKMPVKWHNTDNYFKVYAKTGNVCVTWQWGAFMEPLLPWRSNKYYAFCVCSLKLSSMKSSRVMLYCDLWPARLYSIFSYYLTNGTIFWKKKIIEYQMRLLIYATNFVGKICHSKNKSARYIDT